MVLVLLSILLYKSKYFSLYTTVYAKDLRLLQAIYAVNEIPGQ